MHDPLRHGERPQSAPSAITGLDPPNLTQIRINLLSVNSQTFFKCVEKEAVRSGGETTRQDVNILLFLRRKDNRADKTFFLFNISRFSCPLDK